MLATYDLVRRIRDKAFTLAVARSFLSCGSKTMIRLPAEIRGAERITLGNEVMLGPGGWLQALDRGHVELGDCVRSTRGLVLSAAVHITLEDHVLLGPNVTIVDHDHAHDGDAPIRLQGIGAAAPVTIRSGAWLGANAVVLAGVTVGRNAIVAAGSVVRDDVPDGAVAAGVPAKVRRRRATPTAETSATSV